MSTIITLEAETRTCIGKGASRRLRRLDEKVPAVVYGGNKPPQAIQLLQRRVSKFLECESVYSSVFEILVDGKKERVILKDLQHHPYKSMILHMDLQRVSAKDVLVKTVPLHFINEENAPSVKEGGVVNHTMTQVEIRCEARALPEFIEVDLANLAMNEIIHLSQIKLPKGVELSIDPTTGDHDHPVVSAHKAHVEVDPEPEEADAEAAKDESASDAEEPASDEKPAE